MQPEAETLAPPVVAIPEWLIYEVVDGKPIYYRGYKKYLSGELVNGDQHILPHHTAMGSSILQSEFTGYLLLAIGRLLDHHQYRLATNEAGLQLAKSETRSGDIVIYEKEKLRQQADRKKYATIPPKVVIEIDIEADLESSSDLAYISQKNESLFAFGVERVFWILTETAQVIIAEPNQEWRIRSWQIPVEILEGVTVHIGEIAADVMGE